MCRLSCQVESAMQARQTSSAFHLIAQRNAFRRDGRQQIGYGRAEIQVLDEAWNVVEMIGNEEARPLV